MLYALTSAARQADRIRLFPRAETALWEGDGQPAIAVAVRFDNRNRRVVPLWTDPARFDPAWSTPAQLHADGTVTAKGPIPVQLFLGPEANGPDRSPQDRRPKLLIVDDHAPTRNALFAIFASKGWDVVAVGTIADGLARLDPEPDCLILDLMLPDGRGEVILRAVAEGRLSTRVVVYSAICDLTRLSEVVALRPDALLTKPTEIADLYRAVESEMSETTDMLP